MSVRRMSAEAVERDACARLMSLIAFLPPILLVKLGAVWYVFLLTGSVVVLFLVMFLQKNKRVEVEPIAFAVTVIFVGVYYAAITYLTSQEVARQYSLGFAIVGIMIGYLSFIGILKQWAKSRTIKEA